MRRDKALLFQWVQAGDAGQDIMARAKIGIIGLGGAGSLLAECLGRLGVGEFVLGDPDRAEISSLPRLTAASRLDAMAWFAGERMPAWLRRLGIRLARPKITLARRNIHRANPHARVDAILAISSRPKSPPNSPIATTYFWPLIRCVRGCSSMRLCTSTLSDPDSVICACKR